MLNRNDGHDDFAAFKAALRQRLAPPVFSSWMEDLHFEGRNGDCVTLSTDSRFKTNILDQRFVSMLQDTWRDTIGPVGRILFVTRKDLRAGAARISATAQTSAGARDKSDIFTAPVEARTQKNGGKGAEKPGAPRLADLVSAVDSRATFDSFAVDSSNELACAAARQVLSDTAAREVVYLHGPSGVGKTHLQHAIANEWRRMRGERGFAYITYNSLITGCVAAWFSNSMLSLQKELLSQDLLLIDDVHLLAGRERTQEEVLNLVNAALAAGRRLVIAGEPAPTSLVKYGIDARLADRLAGGLCVGIEPGGPELRMRVLKKRLDQEEKSCVIADDAIDFVARRFGASMRETLGALKQLMLLYRGEAVTIDAERAAEALRGRLIDRRRQPTLMEALTATTKVFTLSEAELTGRSRLQCYTVARHALVYVGRAYLRQSLPRIAAILKRDHTTILSSYRRAEALLQRDEKFRAQVQAIRAEIGA